MCHMKNNAHYKQINNKIKCKIKIKVKAKTR